MSVPLALLLALAPPAVAEAVADATAGPLTLESPDGGITVTVRLEDRGTPAFAVAYRGLPVAAGTLGLRFAGAGPLAEGLTITGTRRAAVDETYAIPVGKASSARDRHRELVVSLREAAAPGRRLELAFRAFDDGVAFRYRLPGQDRLPGRDAPAGFVLTDELTRLTFPGDPTARVLPLKSYTTPYEAYYETRPVSGIGPDRLIGLPVLMERAVDGGDPVWIGVTEADLTDYAGLYLSGVDGEPGTLAAKLSPLPGRGDGAKVVRGVHPDGAPHVSPWRVLMIAGDPGRLLESHIISHLNPPSKIRDPSWIAPGLTTFPWWNHYTVGERVDFEPGVNTATMKYYIDFCAGHGIPYHTLDGLDIAWYGGPIRPRGPTDVTTAAPSIDLPELLRYANGKGVRLRLWVHWEALRPRIDEAFARYERWGIEGVMVDFMDRDDQDMVNFYHELAEKAARHRLTLTLHGAYKPTGMERTWPNVLTYEAVRNQEHNKFGGRGTPPEHNLDAAFVRMLAGPLDYHQGGMRSVLPADYRPRNVAPPVQGTRGHQLAMSVVYQNHLPMAADYPAAYRGQPGFGFLVGVPANWDETRVPHAVPGRCLVVARRRGDAWYLGGMTAAAGCEPALPLGFLGAGTYTAELWLDDPAGGPTAVVRRRRTVTAADTLRPAMPPSGGFAAVLRPASP